MLSKRQYAELEEARILIHDPLSVLLNSLLATFNARDGLREKSRMVSIPMSSLWSHTSGDHSGPRSPFSRLSRRADHKVKDQMAMIPYRYHCLLYGWK